MDISGSYTLYAPRERVWAVLLDPDVLKQTIPGCERLDMQGEDTFLLRLNVGVASIKGIYDGTLRLSDIHPPDRYHMTVDGKSARGVLHGDGALSLEARDANTTVVSYSGQAQLGGPIASVGMRVANGAANMLIKAYFSKLADLLTTNAPAVATAPVAAAPVAAVATSNSTATSATADVLPEEVVDSPFAGPPSAPSVATVEAVPAAPPAVASVASSPEPVRAATLVATATAPVAAAAVLPARGPLMRLVRRAGLTDGSIESERRWARGIIGGIIVVAATIVLIAIFTAQSGHH